MQRPAARSLSLAHVRRRSMWRMRSARFKTSKAMYVYGPQNKPGTHRHGPIDFEWPSSRILGNGTDSLTLVPPSMIGPPEKIHIHRKNTRIPAIVSTVSARSLAWIPWELG